MNALRKNLCADGTILKFNGKFGFVYGKYDYLTDTWKSCHGLPNADPSDRFPTVHAFCKHHMSYVSNRKTNTLNVYKGNILFREPSMDEYQKWTYRNDSKFGSRKKYLDENFEIQTKCDYDNYMY